MGIELAHRAETQGLEVRQNLGDRQNQILTGPLQIALGQLVRRRRPGLDELLALRRARQRGLDQGVGLSFPSATRDIREGDWRVAEIPEILNDRRVEITGPPDRKMVINAMNSGAKVFMADFEDSLTPTWGNLIDGQINLRDAVVGDIRHEQGDKVYQLGPDPATLMVRPRGLHLPEAQLRFDGRPIPGCLFDAFAFLYHNARTLLDSGRHPCLYLPKLENHLEARWWERVLCDIEDVLELPLGTVRVTVLIETLPAAFEMDEILYELRSRVLGLNCGRWDYIFSYIKTLKERPGHVLPDRQQVTMDRRFLRCYSQALVRSCHRRGAHAMGGMAAQIPVRDDSEANVMALAKVREDKRREVSDGHDGTWVAHPGLVPVAMDVFEKGMSGVHQRDLRVDDLHITADDLLSVPRGEITLDGVRSNVRVALRYLGHWMDGRGCVPIDNLMEDAATAEIARTQLWQWVHRSDRSLADGGEVSLSRIQSLLDEELCSVREEGGPGRFDDAAALIEQVTADERLSDFLVLEAYRQAAKL